MTQKIRSNVYLDTELKEIAREMFKNYGLSLSDGINFLLKQATDKKSPGLRGDSSCKTQISDDLEMSDSRVQITVLGFLAMQLDLQAQVIQRIGIA